MTTDTQQQRFNLSFATVKAWGDAENPTPRITCTASSDEVDLGTDRFMVSALRQMRETFPGMTIFLNHKYAVPEDVFGVVKNATVVERSGHYDLDLDIEVDINNDRAMTTFNQIRSGAKLGVSVGVLVLDAEVVNEFVDGKKVKVLNIKSVETLEASIVGIPANRRSWVQGALKAASYVAGEDDDDGGPIMAARKKNSVVDALDEITDETDEIVAVADETPVAVAAEPVAELDDDEDEEEDAKKPPFPPKKPGEKPDDDDDDKKDEVTAEPVAVEPVVEEAEDDGEGYIAHAASSRGQVVAALRKAVSDPDRDWYTIKDATAVETEDGETEQVAEILIYDAIGDGLGSKDFVEMINNLEADHINVRLNSPGGVITDGIAIRNALTRHSAKVTTYVDGLAASMASIIAVAGDEVVMEPESMLMIHEPWGCQMGDASDMEREARILNKYANQLAGVYARKAGGEREDWRNIMRDEGWYTPEEALDAGLIDRVGSGSDSDAKVKSATFDAGIISLFKHAPAAVKGYFKTADATTVAQKTGDAAALLEMSKGITELGSSLRTANAENETLRKQVADLEADVAAKDAKLVAAAEAEVEIVKFVNRIAEAPLPRKIVPEAEFEALSEKYGWLDARIVAALARGKTQAE